MDFKKMIFEAAQRFGLYNLVVDLFIVGLEKAIDRSPAFEALTDELASGGTLQNALMAYANTTPDISDDDIPFMVDTTLESIEEGINRLRSEPFLDVVGSIEIFGEPLGDIKLPDMTEDDDTDNLTVGDVLRKVLA